LPDRNPIALCHGCAAAGRHRIKKGSAVPQEDMAHSASAYRVIRPRPGWAALDVRQLWQFRDLLVAFAARDVRLRYKQTALGIVWVILQPILGAAIFSFVFGLVANLPSDGVPYFVFSYAGLVGWTLFSGTLVRISGCLVQHAHLISKIFFPRLILPLSTIPTVLLDFGVAIALMAALMAIHGMALGWGVLLLPLCVAILLALALGTGICAASLAVNYRDIQFILPVVVQLWLYASPIAYSVEAVPDHLRPYYFLNPLAAPLEAFRWSLLGTGNPHWSYLAYAAAVAAVVLAAGLAVFRATEKKIADVI
jgi:lipopolysaccharide transport system permease protein